MEKSAKTGYPSMNLLIELPVVKDTPSDYDELEKEIQNYFREEIYQPIIDALSIPRKAIKNTLEDLLIAIQTNKISFYRGFFSGRFSSQTSSELRKLGAKWDPSRKGYALGYVKLPIEVRNAISLSASFIESQAKKIDRAIEKVLPAKIAEVIQFDRIFYKLITKTDKNISQSMKHIIVSPQLTPVMKERIAKEYSNNMMLYVQGWKDSQIKKLRREVAENVYKGMRYENLYKMIQKSYGASQNKAKFLARQETNLLITKFKEVRYTEAGVNKYKWKTVVGSAKHPVRPMHKIHDGKIFRWDSPPIVNIKGERKNPGEDYNCRCVAIPIVSFKTK